MKDKSILIIIFVILFALASFLFFEYQNKGEESQDINNEDSVVNQEIPAEEGYPDNVLDGSVEEINSEGNVYLIKLNARLYKIVSDAGEEVKDIKVPRDTEIFSYDVDLEEQKEMSFEDINVGDDITVAVEESTFEDISRETFTAFRVTKFLISEENN